MRLGLAFRAFFAILLGWALPRELADLPEFAALLPEPEPVAALPAVAEAARAQLPEVVESPPVKVTSPLPEVAPRPEPTPPTKPDASAPAPDGRQLDGAAVQVLAVLQSEGRLLDFLAEDIDSYSDGDIGAAVRDVHRGLRRALADHFPVSPLRSEQEEARLTIPMGFDPAAVRLVGNVVGSPPFSGTLRHRGWRVESVRLPRIPEGDAAKIAAPAEVEV